MDGLPAAVVVETPQAATVEAAADAAVQVAQIQADRDVAIAEVVAETDQAATAARVEIAAVEAEQEDEDVAWLRGELSGLRVRCETAEAGLSGVMQQQNEMQAQLTTLAAMMTAYVETLTPPAHLPARLETAPASQAEIDVGNGGVRSEVATEPEPAPIPKTRKRRWL
jgi:hypothetical protein